MKLLLDDALAPTTSTIGFFETDVEPLIRAFIEWQENALQSQGATLSKRDVSGSLREVLSELLPLAGPRRSRYLFLPTASEWIAFFDNGTAGTDATSVCMHLSRVIRCRALRVTAIPHEHVADRGRYGACTLELFGPGGGPLGYLRTISVVNDGGAWAFDQSGTPLPFERTENYKRRKITERFTCEDLRDYADSLGVRPFDEQFYRPGNARLVELRS
jgi:hypothetical protein